MSQSIINDNYFLLYSLILGVIITFVYDVFRIIRRVIPHNSFFVSLEDIVFWIFCALSVFYLMHQQNDGMLRWFAILGAAVGMFLYKKTISPFFVKFTSWILSKIFGFFAKPMKKGIHKGARGVQFLKKKLTTLIKLFRIILCKQ